MDGQYLSKLPQLLKSESQRQVIRHLAIVLWQ